jgi:hypothetical protein
VRAGAFCDLMVLPEFMGTYRFGAADIR